MEMIATLRFHFGLFELDRQLQINGNSDQRGKDPPANAWNIGDADSVPG